MIGYDTSRYHQVTKNLNFFTHSAKIFNFWIPFLSGLAIIITFLGSTFVLVRSLISTDFISTRVLIRTRRMTICKILCEQYEFNRRELHKANREFTREMISSGARSSILSEIEWLSVQANSRDSNWVRPIELHGITRKVDLESYTPASQLEALSRAYLQLSQFLRAQVLLNSNQLMVEQQEFSFLMARYLDVNAKFCANTLLDPDVHKIKIVIPKMKLELFNTRINFAPRYQINHVAMIHHKNDRLVVKNLPNIDEWKSEGKKHQFLEIDGPELSRLSSKFSSGRSYDAVLPALRNHHLQLDPASGHLRLLLEISEINYSSVIANHYVGDEGGIGYTAEQLVESATKFMERRLITLSMLPVSCDGYLLLAERSDHVGVEKLKLQPGVVGNLEFRDRIGIKLDVDEFGEPDALIATAREAKEELGLDVDPGKLQILGLGKFSSEIEIETWLHMTVAQFPLTFNEMIEISKQADLTEGAWEFSGKFVKIAFPKTSKDATDLIAWAIHSDATTPHLVLTLLSLCLPILSQESKKKLSEFETRHFWMSQIESIKSGGVFDLPRGFEEVQRDQF